MPCFARSSTRRSHRRESGTPQRPSRSFVNACPYEVDPDGFAQTTWNPALASAIISSHGTGA